MPSFSDSAGAYFRACPFCFTAANRMCSLQMSGGTNCRAKPFFLQLSTQSGPVPCTGQTRTAGPFHCSPRPTWPSGDPSGTWDSRIQGPSQSAATQTSRSQPCFASWWMIAIGDFRIGHGHCGIATTKWFSFQLHPPSLCKARQLKQMMGPPPTSIATKSQEFFNLHIKMNIWICLKIWYSKIS